HPSTIKPPSLHDALPICAACQRAEDVEQLRLVVEVEAVAGFRLDRGRPIGEETVGAALRQPQEHRSIGLVGCPHGSRDASLARLDRKSTRLNSSHGSISY